jgi:prevent-host-death family protein
MDPEKFLFQEIGAFEAKNRLGSLLDHVEQGAEIVITRHGKPVARLVPHVERIDRAKVQAAFKRIRERTQLLHEQSAGKERLDWATLKRWRDEGRP